MRISLHNGAGPAYSPGCCVAPKQYPAMKKIILILTLAYAMSACEAETDVAPAPGVQEAEGIFNAAVSQVDGVNMTVQSDAWTGPAAISQEVVPLRVEIQNESARPVRVQYDGFALVTPEGERHSALPPYEIEGEVTRPVLSREYDPMEEVGWEYDDYQLAPYYGPIYPDVTTYEDDWYWKPTYYNEYYTYWSERDLPTPEMLMNALPEGVVNAGGNVSGFIYFEEVEEDADRVRFVADLVDAETGSIFGEISIPMTVQEVEEL